ncbi:MAG TPA: GntR family transcriptional regulator [Acidimicrobiales bacterium]|jgi:DNA-binding GntR family transcriptional regulator|nr:GntR family transcriptional regulator [Acidimicrobiales bacterium]
MYTEQHTADSAASAPRPSRAEQAYAEIKRQLLLGELPLGARLGEERLASSLGLSRTPVREALFRLHSEGLIDRHPDGGYRPRAPIVSGIRELYEVRLGLELLAIRRPFTSGHGHDRTMLEHVRDEWLGLSDEPPEPDPGFVVADEAFHLGIAEAAGNLELVELLSHVNQRIRTVRMQDFMATARIAATVDQHLHIVTALLDEDLEGATAALTNHLSESMAIVETLAARALARMLERREERT